MGVGLLEMCYLNAILNSSHSLMMVLKVIPGIKFQYKYLTSFEANNQT